MGSLLQKAIDFIKHRPGEDALSEDTQGIPEEDRKEILSEIDKIAARNRIAVTPELFVIKAKKRGIALPLIVNLGAVVILCAGLYLMYTLFRQEEQTLSGDRGLSSSVEGKLLEEMKREAEARLSQKDLEIKSIQEKLSEINRERESLEETMESRIRGREEELRASIDAELRALREELSSQGASESVIEEELRRLEEERTAQCDRQIAEIRREAEEERAEMEASLRRLEQETNETLAKANSEKGEILNAMAAREEALRSQYEAKIAGTEARLAQAQEEIAGTEESLSQAREELALLSEQKDREDYLTGQTAGMYASLRENLREENINEAEADLQRLKALLNDEIYLSTASLRERRTADLFIVESLENLLLKEKARRAEEGETLEPGKEAAAAPVEPAGPSAEYYAEADKLIEEAEAFVLAGQYEEAVDTYLSLLMGYPESDAVTRVPESFSALVRSQNEELARMKTQAEELDRLRNVNSRLTELSQERLEVIRNLETELKEKIAEQEAFVAQRADDTAEPTDQELLAELERLKEIEALKARLQ
ncbi:MAG: hypothetical protein JW760_07620, partial [Spirochaetales bacterium]|nr:hypothetical protein [Spirochaetales bacterium]